MSACAIVQARMGSSRFPGKMLRELAGKPLLWHVIHRLEQCQTISQIILATSDQASDDELARYAASLGVAVIRGPENNVLQRFVMALTHTKADIIVRITGDAVLIDPELIDRLVERLHQSGAGYILTTTAVSDCGIDPVTRETLLRIANERSDHPAAIEHVTGYLQIDSGFARRALLPTEGENRLVQAARFSIDTPADLAFMQAIYDRLRVSAGEAKFIDVLALVRNQPELLSINAHVRQRRPDEKPFSVLIRCDGGRELGLGHIVRCLAIATALRDRFSAAVTFAVGGDEAAFELVHAQAFPIKRMSDRASRSELKTALHTVLPDVTLLDLRTPFDPDEISTIRETPSRLAILDDPGPRRFHADISFFPPSAAELDWTEAKGEVCIGFEWIPLRAQFSPPPPLIRASPPTALILAGGSDPAGIGQRFLARASQTLPDSWCISMVIGAATAKDTTLDALAKSLGDRLTLHRGVSDMASLMARADLALAVFGMTAYELSATGVPSIVLCLSADHFRSAQHLAKNGAARVLGIAQTVSDDEIDRTISDMTSDSEIRETMSRKSRALIDGFGANRIAARIATLAQHAQDNTAA